MQFAFIQLAAFIVVPFALAISRDDVSVHGMAWLLQEFQLLDDTADLQLCALPLNNLKKKMKPRKRGDRDNDEFMPPPIADMDNDEFMPPRN